MTNLQIILTSLSILLGLYLYRRGYRYGFRLGIKATTLELQKFVLTLSWEDRVDLMRKMDEFNESRDEELRKRNAELQKRSKK